MVCTVVMSTTSEDYAFCDGRCSAAFSAESNSGSGTAPLLQVTRKAPKLKYTLGAAQTLFDEHE